MTGARFSSKQYSQESPCPQMVTQEQLSRSEQEASKSALKMLTEEVHNYLHKHSYKFHYL